MSLEPDIPAWVKDAVFYQIFPDRFARSGRIPKPNNLEPWDEPPTGQGYKGGDLLGIVERLDHLTELGVNAIYLNPVFQSACNHRYHTHDYYQVDPLLGGNEALRELIDAAHARGMRVMLDGVFNHASRGFFQFSDILENGPHSAWLDWFIIQDWPLNPYTGDKPANYASWWDNRALPKFNTDNQQVREFLMRVAEFWLREYDIDGWRLDVPEEITTPGFWEEFRQRVRAVKPDAYIVGEIWTPAADWLRGDRFDAVMNYVFTEAIIAFTAGDRVSPSLIEGRAYKPYPGIDAAEFGARIQKLLDLYGWEATLGQFNLLDSHDTSRLTSIARGDQATLRLATLFQMCYPGAPCVYYGDEVGIQGISDYDAPHDDAQARWTMPWDRPNEWDNELFAYFQEIIRLRHREPALRHGRYQQLYAEGQLYAFSRELDGRSLIILLNSGEEAHTADLPGDSGPAPDILFGQPEIGKLANGRLPITIAAREGVVLAAA
jgi:cyclomaltodextrinase / maltogenic alpha-amylase / neopullulanase